MNLDYAIAKLDVALKNAENNEPIQRKEGQIAQADLNKERIESFKLAITKLEALNNAK